MRENTCKTEKASERKEMAGGERKGERQKRKHISEEGKAQEADEKHKTVRMQKHAREGKSVKRREMGNTPKRGKACQRGKWNTGTRKQARENVNR